MTQVPKYHLATLALVREDRVLLVRKRGLEELILPGGKIEAGESFYETLQRECREELGTEVRRNSVKHLGTFVAPKARDPDTLIRVELFSGELYEEPVASAEIEELVWVDLTNYSGHVLAPSLTLKILPYLAGTLRGPDRVWRPAPDCCLSCGARLEPNCRDCTAGDEERCDEEGCACGLAVMCDPIPLLPLDDPDRYGGRRVSALLGQVPDRVVGPGYVLLSAEDYVALVSQADAAWYGESGGARRLARSGKPDVQAVPRGTPHLAKLFEGPVAARTLSVDYYGGKPEFFSSGDSPRARDSTRAVPGAPEPDSSSVASEEDGEDAGDKRSLSVWTLLLVAVGLCSGLVLVWNYLIEPMVTN